MASSSSGGYVSRYDVFLSFRGEDTRNKFTDHLYDKLLRAGVFTFRDNEAIPRGEELTPEIKRGIRESRASIIVLSENYATSRWCLEELCLILEQRRDRNHYVLPIFYHVDPSHVRNQKGTFEINVAPNTKWTDDNVKRWKAALEKVGEMTGEVDSSSRSCIFQDRIIQTNIMPETKSLEDIVELIRYRLDLKQVYRQANLVGMENQDKEINSWLEQSDSDILAIWGMEGGGKTTLSRHIAYSNWKKFDSVSIIEDIASRPPEGLRQLQEKLIKDIIEGKGQTNPSSWQGTYTIENALERRKALIILDNIVTKKQLEALVGIGTGTNTQSKIIITTEKSGSSKWFKSPSWRCQEYEIKLLENEDSYKLLKLHAFELDDPTEDYEELANKVLKYCQGHPLSLEVLGSCLKDDKTKDVWESRFKSFERELHGDIKKVLRIGYDSLPLESHRNLFLHIACFFIGKNKDFVGKILEPDYSATSGIITLTKSCLLFVSPNNKLNMHPLLKEMGRTIVYDESPQRPGKRSRVWRNEDSYDVLINKKGSTKVEGLALDMEILSKEHVQLLNLKTDSFKKMDSLKLLKLNQLERVTGSYNKFSKHLRWLCWRDFRLDKIPPKLDMGKLVAIDMSCSKLEVFELPKVLESLKFLNLKECYNLEKIENISRLPNLQKLNLRNCFTLVRVHDTLGDLTGITLLNLTGCKNLWQRAKLSEGDKRNQPQFLLPNSLKQLLLMGCNLEDTHYFPLNFKDQPRLEYINLAYNPVELLPSYTHLYNLRVLDLSYCTALKKLLCLPSKLAELYIFHCNSLETVTFESHKYNLQEFRYEGCINLSVVEDFFKFVLVAMLTEADLGHMSWLRQYQDREVSLVGDDDLTKGRNFCLQMLYEFNIMSVSLPDIQKQNLTSEYEYTSEHGYLSFSVPKSPMNRRLKGLNLTFKYTIQGDTWVWFAKITTNKGVDLIYNPKVFGKPASDEVGVWISYWPIGESLQDEDVVDVAIVVMIGLEIKGCGASLVYTDNEDETESFEDNDVTMVKDNNNTFKDSNEHADILRADIAGFKLSTGTYYLCRRDYFELMEVGRLTPNWFKNLVGDTIDYTEIGGWRKTGRPDQPYRSYTKLKTDGCIIYGPHLEELYKIEELSESSLSDKTKECTSEFSKDATKDKDESANLETMNLSKAFDYDEIWESTSIPHADAAATKATKTLGSSYDVFVSFQDENTSFTNHLYDALKNAGISTSLDIEAIHRGEKLESQIKTQIEQSKVSIVVISEAYATSALCLDELAFILEQRRRRNHQILPVFYNVIPSDIWREYGSLSFLEDNTSIWTVHNGERWKEALKDVANISGMLISRKMHEADVLINIIDHISKRLNHQADLPPDTKDSKSSLSDKTKEYTSEFSKDATKDKDESANLETTNESIAFDFNEIWETTSIPHGDSAATKVTKDKDESSNLETTNQSIAFDFNEIWKSIPIQHRDSAATKDKDESANIETTNQSIAFDFNEIWESISMPYGDSAATKDKDESANVEIWESTIPHGDSAATKYESGAMKQSAPKRTQKRAKMRTYTRNLLHCIRVPCMA